MTFACRPTPGGGFFYFLYNELMNITTVKQTFQARPLLVWLVAGSCLGLSNMNALLSILVFPGIVLFLYGLTINSSGIDIFWYSWLTGTLKSLGALAWLWQLDPVTWNSTTVTSWSLGMLSFYWVGASLVIGLGLAATALVYYRLQRHGRIAWFLLPVLYIMGEIIGSGLFMLYTWAPQAPIHLGMTLGYSGYALIQIPLLASAALLGGVYVLSGLLVSLAQLTLGLLQGNRLYSAITLTILILGSAGLSTLTTSATSLGKQIIVAETNYPMAQLNTETGYAARNQAGKDMVDTALTYEPDYIVLQEHGNFTRNFPDSTTALQYLTDTATTDVVVIDTLTTTTASHKRAIVGHLYDTARVTTETRYKAHLTPIGEYLPVYHQLVLEIVTPKTIWGWFISNKNFIVPPTTPRDFSLPGLLFCYESLVPWYAKKVTTANTPFVAHTVSHGWFKNATILTHQQSLMLRSQAMFSGKPIIQATNLGPHAVYGSDGSVSRGTSIEKADQWELFIINI